MRVSQEEKDRSHQRIVENAARLMRERGIEATGVADVMAAAGLTHGGFYRHFGTKEELLTAALEAAFDQMMSELDPAAVRTEPSTSPLASYEALYLSDGHVRNPGIGCPVAALAGDVGRGSSTLKSAFSAGFNLLVTRLSLLMKGSDRKRREQAARRLAMMAGAVMIARASDAKTAREVLEACRPDPK